MAEQSESVRGDAPTREIKQKEIVDWSGRRVILPRGTTLPAISVSRIVGEVFVLERSGARDQLYIYDEDVSGGNPNWVTVGP